MTVVACIRSDDGYRYETTASPVYDFRLPRHDVVALSLLMKHLLYLGATFLGTGSSFLFFFSPKGAKTSLERPGFSKIAIKYPEVSFGILKGQVLLRFYSTLSTAFLVPDIVSTFFLVAGHAWAHVKVALQYSVIQRLHGPAGT